MATPCRRIHCWDRRCVCRRNRSATCGRPRSVWPHNPGLLITGSARWRCCRGRSTARWHWRPPAPRWARLPRSATSSSNRRCYWTSRPPSVPRRRWHHRASPTSWWSRNRVAVQRGWPPQSCVSPRMSSRPPTTSPHCLPRIRIPWTAPRCEPHWIGAVFSTARRSPASVPCTPTGMPTGQCSRRSHCRARSVRRQARTAFTRHCWMPASSRWAPVIGSVILARMRWDYRWESRGCAPTTPPETRTTATPG